MRPKLNFLQIFSLLSLLSLLGIAIALSVVLASQAEKIFTEQQRISLSKTISEQAHQRLPFSAFLPDGNYLAYQAQFRDFTKVIQVAEILSTHIWHPDGTILYSTDEELIGEKFPPSPGLSLASSTRTSILQEPHSQNPLNPRVPASVELRDLYVPITLESPGGIPRVAGIVEVYLDVAALEAKIRSAQIATTASTFSAFFLLYLLLFGVARRASETIRKQSNALQEYATTLEEKIKQRTRELEEAQKRELALKDEFVFIAAHELREPATIITGFVDLLTRRKLSKEKKNIAFEAMMKSGKRLGNLVENILEISRVEMGRINISTTPVNLEQVVQTAVESFSTEAVGKGLRLSYEKPKNPLPKVWADPSRVDEIMVNLLTNAIKFTKKGGITVGHMVDENNVTTFVSDSGVGMGKEELSHVFEKFWRSNEVSRIQGSGLGLFVVRQIAERMGGKIWVESEEEKGSTFYFSLQIVKSEIK